MTTRSKRTRAAREGVRATNCARRAWTRRSTRPRRGSRTSKRCARRWAMRSWNLWGGSYGTRVAPGIPAAASGPHSHRRRSTPWSPPSMISTLDVWRTREATLRRGAARLHAVAGMQPTPPGPRRDRWRRLPRRLDPDGRDIDVVDPRTGKVSRHQLTFDGVLALLQPLTVRAGIVEPAAGNAGAARSPATSARCSRRRRRSTTNLAEQMNAALHFSVTCAEDVPRITPDVRATALAGLQTRAACRKVDRGVRRVAAGHACRPTSRSRS